MSSKAPSTLRSAGALHKMPFLSLPSSPLVPRTSPVSIHYREQGAGLPILFLHGGWGYEMYPLDRQIEVLSATRRIIIPDRSGYGRSPRPASNGRLRSE